MIVSLAVALAATAALAGLIRYRHEFDNGDVAGASWGLMLLLALALNLAAWLEVLK